MNQAPTEDLTGDWIPASAGMTEEVQRNAAGNLRVSLRFSLFLFPQEWDKGVEKAPWDNLPGKAAKPEFLDIPNRANLESSSTYPNGSLRPEAKKVLHEMGPAEGRSVEVY